MPFFRQDETLTTLVNQVLEETWQKFPKLARNQIALTWIVYDPPVIVNTGGAISAEEFWRHPVRGCSYRGLERIYPASIVKLFYLVAIEEWLESKMIPDSRELDRATQAMIKDSSNDATSLIVDSLTGTTSGPELPPSPFETWKQQRNLVNRYYQSLGWEELKNVNINQKTWGDGAYGRERAFLGELMENRNMLTTDAVARLLHSIIGGIAVSSERSQKMMQWLRRDLNLKNIVSNGEENQVVGFIGQGLPPEARLWSKAGWTSQVRHDAAYLEIPNQTPYLLVVFTEGQENSQNKAIIPFISQSFVKIIENFA
jgi:hypothetical protein